MIESLALVLSCAAGGLLGAFFFGGLWWTIRRGFASTRPAFWFAGSMFVRLGVTLGGFYLVADHHWQRMLACLIGFLIARVVVTRITRPKANTSPATGTNHAP